jgi:hypothetical protein
MHDVARNAGNAAETGHGVRRQRRRNPGFDADNSSVCMEGVMFGHDKVSLGKMTVAQETDEELAAIMNDDSVTMVERLRRKQQLLNSRILDAADENENGKHGKVSALLPGRKDYRRAATFK